MGRSPCCSKQAGLNRGSWTALEDKILTDYIRIHGEGRWRNLPLKAGLKRCGKSCRLRWLNYLRPDIKRGNISPDEEELIIRLHKLLGNRWSLIAGRLPGRTDNEIKNYWNTNLGKKVHNINTKSTPIKNNDNSVPSKPSKAENPSSSHGPASEISPARVVRTRAVKCTKLVLLNNNGGGDNGVVLGKDPAEGNLDNSSGVIVDQGLGSDGGAGCDGSFVIPQSSSESAVNFGVDELFLADLLANPEFPCDDDYFRDMNFVDNAHQRHHHHHHHDDDNDLLMFSKESTVPDWSSSVSNSNDNLGVVREEIVGPNYFSSLSSFVGGEEGDWLAAD